jgi:hypothetical protein
MRSELLELADHQRADLDARVLAAVKVLREGVASSEQTVTAGWPKAQPDERHGSVELLIMPR